jgi:hypothetical protein
MFEHGRRAFGCEEDPKEQRHQSDLDFLAHGHFRQVAIEDNPRIETGMEPVASAHVGDFGGGYRIGRDHSAAAGS